MASSSEVTWVGALELANYLVPIEELVEFPGNPVRGDTQLLLYSLANYGQVRPVLTWENAEEFGFQPNTLVAGHHVVKCARMLDWTHVAVMPAAFESEELARKYLALDNITALREQAEMNDQFSFLDEVAEDDAELAAQLADARAFREGLVSLETLKPHERNVKEHPEEQLDRIKASLEALGFTKPIVVAKDGTVLAGHGVMKAAAMLGITQVPVKRLDVGPDDPAALAYMIGDNELGRGAELQDREMAEMLRELQEETGDILGTGYDTQMLANLLLVTRSAAEIKDSNQAIEWLGMPEYEQTPLPCKVMVSFDSDVERDKFLDGWWSPDGLKANAVQVGAVVRKRNLSTISLWWPPRPRDDPHSLRFVDKEREVWKEQSDAADAA
jgi:ParB-like chromosome segregation protein Spo0J